MSAFGRAAGALGRLAVREGPRLVAQLQQRAAPARRAAGERPSRRRPSAPPDGPAPRRSATATGAAPGSGRTLAYAPQPDGQADPGEVVWTWVAYEDDPSRGKDRPGLVVGREGSRLLALVLSSQADRDGQRNWLALGPGAWDAERRPSWVRLDRVLEVDEDDVRREGAVLDRRRFDLVADRLRASYGWAPDGGGDSPRGGS